MPSQRASASAAFKSNPGILGAESEQIEVAGLGDTASLTAQRYTPTVGARSYPNREVLSFAVRAIAGWFPIVVLVVPVYGIFVILWLSNQTDPVFTGLWVAFTVAVIVVGYWVSRTLRVRVPNSIELASDELTAVWNRNPAHRETVPFGSVTAIDARHWTWIPEYKASHYGFTPGSVHYRRSSDGRDDNDGQDEANSEVVYLTDANLERVKAAFIQWGGPQSLIDSAPLPDNPDAIDPSENPDGLPLGWVKCLGCGAALKSHKEIEAGLCATCLRGRPSKA